MHEGPWNSQGEDITVNVFAVGLENYKESD